MEPIIALQATSTSSNGLDYVVLGAMAAIGFFVVLAFIMLARYRRVSQRVSEASDLGKDLYESLEGRLRKQDERILDVMTRLEVLQSRALETSRKAEIRFEPRPPMVSRPQTPPPEARSDIDVGFTPSLEPVPAPAPAERYVTPPPAHRPEQESGELRAMRLLGEGPKTSVEIKNRTGMSREHAARIMKSLYDKGWVLRDAEHKPFLYQLSETGKSHVAAA